MFVTIFIGNNQLFTIDLDAYGEKKIRFGRSSMMDIQLPSKIVSSFHGAFEKEGEDWKVIDYSHRNGLYVDGQSISKWNLSDGLKIYIGSENHCERVVFLCSNIQNNPSALSLDEPTDSPDPDGGMIDIPVPPMDSPEYEK